MGSPSNPSTHLQVLHSSTLLDSYLHSHLALALTSTHPMYMATPTGTCTYPPALVPALPHLHLPSRTHTYPPTLTPALPHSHLPSCTRTCPPAVTHTLPHSHLPSRTRTYPPHAHLHPTHVYPPHSRLPTHLLAVIVVATIAIVASSLSCVLVVVVRGCCRAWLSCVAVVVSFSFTTPRHLSPSSPSSSLPLSS